MPEVKSPKQTAGWIKVAFGDVVRLCTERSSDPEADGFERYIGLEHLDPGELRVRRWGDLADGVTFTNVFRPGQVLFGKRRAYQRKVAVADFSGVCSGDIYVLEPKGDALLPELLPFICQTDAFFEHAVGTSAGSLSPRTNWESLADFEFALPPIAEQRRVGLAMSAAQAARDCLHTVVQQGEAMRDCLIARLLEFGLNGEPRRKTDMGRFPRAWQVVPLQDRYDVQLGKMISPAARAGSFQVPYMRNANVQWGRLDLSDVATMSIAESERDRFGLRPGDILACEGRHVGKSVIWNNEIPGACYQKALHRLRPHDRAIDLPEFMLLCLRFYSVSGRFTHATGETTIPHLPAERFREIVFPFPPVDEQRLICARVAELDRQLDTARDRADAQKRMLESLMREAIR